MPIYRVKGIVARCSLATTPIRVNTKRVMGDILLQLLEGARVDVLIDDIAITVEGVFDAWKNVVGARSLIQQVVTDRLKCQFVAGEGGGGSFSKARRG